MMQKHEDPPEGMYEEVDDSQSVRQKVEDEAKEVLYYYYPAKDKT